MVEIERNSAIGNRFISIVEVSQRAIRTKEYMSEKSRFAYKYLRQLMDLQELISFCERTYQQIIKHCNLTLSVGTYNECR